MKNYDPAKIEKKWQAFWQEKQCFHAKLDKSKKKFYPLVEFPYPSGQGLHVGHPRSYTAMDVVARKRRMQGYNVLYPMGYDAFGLPTENYAIKHNIHPAEVTRENIKRFRKQLDSIGCSFDWERQVNTTDPKYYRWTQWIFLQLYKHGLAYKQETPINWCPDCKVGLSNEEVVGGKCERCGSPVEHRVKNQWMLKITEYADRLIDDLEEVDFSPRIKQQQINWIGRSYGAEVDFALSIAGQKSDDKIRVFTTRPDTLFGATYMVLAPEHPLIKKYAEKISNMDKVKEYQHQALMKSDFERGELNKEKTGLALEGIKAINPVNRKEIPVWISDYVLMSYGTGAIMAVPAHDERDWEFAKKFNLPIIEVVAGAETSVEEAPFTDVESGKLINSDFLNGLSVEEAKKKILDKLVKEGLGQAKKNFKLRDWVFSRQRYWGEPIPMVYCPEHGWQPLGEDQLPLVLPQAPNYQPTATGESPLSEIESFVNTTCPVCGGPAKRETDTMPQWAGSSWYYLRYMDPHNDKAPVSKETEEYFGPVDWYNGGMEHTTLHLLYSRFWHKFLYDLGLVSTKEPYMKRTSHGMILGDNGEKMSKSRGNVVNPDDIVQEYGADTLRTYEMFIGDFEKGAIWSTNGIPGARKFLDRVWKLSEILNDSYEYSAENEKLIHQTIKKVSEDYEKLKFNTAIAQLMTLSNSFKASGSVSKKDWETFLILLNPVAPHITEELWELTGLQGHIATDAVWPEYSEDKLEEDLIEMPVQVNGKLRAQVKVKTDADKDEILALALEEDGVKRQLEGKKIIKVIYVAKKIFNLVIK